MYTQCIMLHKLYILQVWRRFLEREYQQQYAGYLKMRRKEFVY